MTERVPLPTAPPATFRHKRMLESAGERLRHVSMPSSARSWLKRAYHAALMLQTGGRGLPCLLPHGEIVRTLPDHRYLSWNRDEYDAFRAAARPGMVALDAGANVGAYAVLLGQWAAPGGVVFAFEPSPEPFDGLVRHVELNGVQDVVRPLRVAIGDCDRSAAFVVAPTAGESRLAGDAEHADAVVTVPVTSIDAFCARERIDPDFIKVDVEGWELAVLRGARRTIRRQGRRLALFVEMHPSIWPTLGCSHADVRDELRAQHLEAMPLTDVADPWAIEGVCMRLVPR